MIPYLMVASFAMLIGCGADSSAPLSQCVETLPSTCTPLFDPPTFDSIYTQIIQTKCSEAGGACHAQEGAQGGLALDDADEAYQALTAVEEGPRILAGDPECSLLVDRLQQDPASGGMPPGNPLSEAERCAIVQWIRSGATR